MKGEIALKTKGRFLITLICAACCLMILVGCSSGATATKNKIETEAHSIGGTFSVAIPKGCESHQTAEDTLKFVPKSADVTSSDNYVQIGVSGTVPASTADQLVHIYFKDDENNGVKYKYDNVVSSEINGHPLISADETRTFKTGDTAKNKMICFAVSEDDNTAAVYSIKAAGFTQEYLESIASSIKLL